jgi:hypothetical protein
MAAVMATQEADACKRRSRFIAVPPKKALSGAMLLLRAGSIFRPLFPFPPLANNQCTRDQLAVTSVLDRRNGQLTALAIFFQGYFCLIFITNGGFGRRFRTAAKAPHFLIQPKVALYFLQETGFRAWKSMTAASFALTAASPACRTFQVTRAARQNRITRERDPGWRSSGPRR